MTNQTNLPRTKAEAILAVRYNIRLHWLQRRLYKRARSAIALMTAIASSAALAGAIHGSPAAVAGVGFLIAAISYVDLVIDFADKAATHDVQRKEYAALLADSSQLTLEQIDARLASFAGDMADGLEPLRVVAWNDTLQSFGFEDGMRTETRFQRLMRAVA